MSIVTGEVRASHCNTSVKAGQPQCSPRSLNDLLGAPDSSASTKPVFAHRTVKTGQYLVRAGQAFDSLYVINGGFFKTVFTDDCGNEQVMAFPMKGDLLGTDGIGNDKYINDVVALSDADVVIIPFKRLDTLIRLQPGLDDLLFRIISQQLIQEQLSLTAIGALCAESRVARFLLNIGERMARQGYSGRQFNLRMSRHDMGSYLGMKIETVSRTLTSLTKQGMIAVDQRELTLIDTGALQALGRNGPVKTRAKPDVSVPVQRSKNATPNPQVAGAPGRAAPATPATPWSSLTRSTEATYA